MGTDFPRMLALLRKEQGVSQKKVAKDLEVSQALLSHYERGIRNPGLEFLVKVADYYSVSTDYLLGRSPERQGQTLYFDDIPSPEDGSRGNQGMAGMFTQLNKKLIANSQNILFDLLTRMGNKGLTGEVSAYLMLAIYRMHRVIVSTNPKNKEEMFRLPDRVTSQYVAATMQLIEANLVSLAAGKPIGEFPPLTKEGEMNISEESLAKEYPLFASSLLNLIQNVEVRIGYGRRKEK